MYCLHICAAHPDYKRPYCSSFVKFFPTYDLANEARKLEKRKYYNDYIENEIQDKLCAAKDLNQSDESYDNDEQNNDEQNNEENNEEKEIDIDEWEDKRDVHELVYSDYYMDQVPFEAEIYDPAGNLVYPVKMDWDLKTL